MIAIPYKIFRSDRKTIVLVIDSSAKLIVRAPYSALETEITGLIKKKKRWILEKQQQITEANKKLNPAVIKNGGTLLYLGNSYTIAMEKVSKIRISGENIIMPKGIKKEKVIAWLKKEAGKLLRERAAHYADIMSLQYSTIKITSAKTRWGSCSGKNNLNFTWRLIMCPPAAIDYVIVHELSHILIKNHSPEFWARVKLFYPDFKKQKKWLKANRKIMDIF